MTYEVMGYYDAMFSVGTLGHMANYDPERWAMLTQQQRGEYDLGWDDVYIEKEEK